jgi:hypothetical protein
VAAEASSAARIVRLCMKMLCIVISCNAKTSRLQK